MVADPAQLNSGREAVARMHRVFETQKQAFAAHPFPDADARREHLARVSRLLLDNLDAWTEAVSADFGNRSASETLSAEVLVTIEGVKHARAGCANG